MANHQGLISYLKIRSGKVVKVNIVKVQETVYQNQVIEIVFMASIASKLCLVMRNTDKERYKVAENVTFFAQNLDHMQSIDEIALFKIASSSKTILKPSKKKETNALVFTEAELEISDAIDISQYINLDEQVPTLPTPTVNVTVTTSPVLSLYEFLLKNPKEIKKDQVVEVKIGIHLK